MNFAVQAVALASKAPQDLAERGSPFNWVVWVCAPVLFLAVDCAISERTTTSLCQCAACCHDLGERA